MGVDPRGILRVAPDPGPPAESAPFTEFEQRIKALLDKYGYDGQDASCALWFAQEAGALGKPFSELRAAFDRFSKPI